MYANDPTPMNPHSITVDDHPLLDLCVFESKFSTSLGELSTPAHIQSLLQRSVAAPLAADDFVRSEIRNLLRHGGFKPTGRSKPASEYLIKAVGDGTLGSINLAVDICNAVSLHSGLPISVVDLDLATSPFQVRVADPGTSYVFNPSQQTMDVGGLLCLFDAFGPCANSVKDSQRTKTSASTRRTLTIIWGSRSLSGRTEKTWQWYHDLLQQSHASVARWTTQ